MDKQSLLLWLNTRDSVDIQMPNEIFEDFDQTGFKTFNHKCFGYAYYYLISYLYRNAAYGNEIKNYSQQNIINVITSDKSSISYITKSNGLLDKLGYTKSTTDYPIAFFMNDGTLEFGFIKELRKNIPDLQLTHSPRLSIKEPVKALARFDGEDYTGTYYSFQNTHKLNVNDFATIMTDDKLGHVGLYIYGYIQMMCDKFPEGYRSTNIDLAKVVGCSERTIKSYMARLEMLNLVSSSAMTLNNRTQKFYSVG